MKQHELDTVEALQQLAEANAHGPLNTEQSNRNMRLIAAFADAQPYACPHGCDVRSGLLPVAAQRWGVEWLHEQHCPLHDDNVPAVQRRDVSSLLAGQWGDDDDAA